VYHFEKLSPFLTEILSSCSLALSSVYGSVAFFAAFSAFLASLAAFFSSGVIFFPCSTLGFLSF
jgi:hypothetical protein